MKMGNVVLAGIATIFAAAACDSPTTPDGTVTISLRSGLAPAGAPVMAAAGGNTEIAAVDIPGLNGTLRIDELYLIVAEFELERLGVECDDAVDEDECEEFEAPPFFVQVPLDGGEEPVVRQAVPPGTYSGLEFEVEDIEADEDDFDPAEIQALFDLVRSQFADWPLEASMLAIGSFAPSDGGDAVPFRVFFEAEIEIEMDFEDPLVVAEGEEVDRTVSVTVDPSVWFVSNGTVVDLSQFDYDTTGDLLEFEFEMDDGFTEIEIDG